MDSINSNSIRVGRFTSSGIHALLSVSRDKKEFGKPALTYIEEKYIERKLGRSLDTDSNSRPLVWGKMLEQRVFELLGTEYRLCSADTLTHSEIEYWVGSPDAIKYGEENTVVDIKCPFTLKSFCIFSDCETIEQVRKLHPDGEKYYWQLISNAILTGCKFAELIVYCPYKSELIDIRDMASNYDGDQNKVAWINWSNDYDLPFLPDGGYYKNIHVVKFEVPKKDIDLITDRIVAAGKLLRYIYFF